MKTAFFLYGTLMDRALLTEDGRARLASMFASKPGSSAAWSLAGWRLRQKRIVDAHR